MPHFDRRLQSAPISCFALRSLFSISTVVAFAILLAGCGSLRLHSDTREKQGEAASKAWSEVDLKGFFAAERANQAKLLEAELASTAELTEANRETEIILLATKPVEQLSAYYDASLRPIVMGGSGPIEPADRTHFETALKSARNELATERAKTLDLERTSSFLKEMGVPAFSCDELTAADPTDVNAWKAKNTSLAKKAEKRLENAKKLCAEIKEARDKHLAAIESFQGGDLKGLATDLANARKQFDKKQAAVNAAKAVYKKDLKDYDDEVKLMKAGKSAVDKTKALAENVATALNGVKKVQGALSEQFISEERIKLIDELLSSLKAGTALDSKGASKAEIAISMFPTIADDISAIGQAKKGRAAVPLLIQRDVEQARLNSANVQLARQQQYLELQSAIVEASVQRAQTLVNARSRVQALTASDADKGLTVNAIWDKLKPEDRVLLLDSTTLYLDAFSRQAALVDTMTTQRLALANDESIDLAEVNASMWSALIGATVNQAAEFSALGIKAEDIEDILYLLGIFYIGHGVNK